MQGSRPDDSRRLLSFPNASLSRRERNHASLPCTFSLRRWRACYPSPNSSRARRGQPQDRSVHRIAYHRVRIPQHPTGLRSEYLLAQPGRIGAAEDICRLATRLRSLSQGTHWRGTILRRRKSSIHDTICVQRMTNNRRCSSRAGHGAPSSGVSLAVLRR